MNDTLANTEKKTAYILTLPAVLLVFSIILFPIFANIWISFKEVELKDIRIPEPRAKKIVKSISDEPTKIKILYKLRNSSLIQEIRDVSFQDNFPNNFEIENFCINLATPCFSYIVTSKNFLTISKIFGFVDQTIVSP